MEYQKVNKRRKETGKEQLKSVQYNTAEDTVKRKYIMKMNKGERRQ
jgi:hypothetical protein